MEKHPRLLFTHANVTATNKTKDERGMKHVIDVSSPSSFAHHFLNCQPTFYQLTFVAEEAVKDRKGH